MALHLTQEVSQQCTSTDVKRYPRDAGDYVSEIKKVDDIISCYFERYKAIYPWTHLLMILKGHV